MAFRAVRYWRSIVGKENGNGLMARSFVASTTPKMATAGVIGHRAQHQHPKKPTKISKELLPLFGMTSVAIMIALHTVYQQLAYSPGVKIAKKKRESLPEIDLPDHTVTSAGKFIDKSFLRKVAHIQNDDRVLPDTSRQPYTRSRDVETLKSVGA